MKLFFNIFLILFNSIKNKNKNNSGYDERYPLIINEDTKQLKLKYFAENYEKKKILLLLKTHNLSMIEKIKMINEFYDINSVKQSNILNGGLLDHWLYDF